MEELQSSDPEPYVHEKELVSPVSAQELVSDAKSLCRNMRDSADGNGGGVVSDPIPGEESGVQEGDQQDQGHGDVDSDLFSRGWSKTGKRVRNSIARVKIPGFSQDEEGSGPGDEAGEPGKQELPLKKRKMPESPVSDTGNGHSSLSGSKVMEPAGEPENDDVADPGAERAVANVNSDNDPTESQNEHVCDICNRSFKSYQALGGHKAHHNDKAEDISFTEEKNGSTRRPPKGNQIYQCALCNKIFSKGQALGGHKRHCSGLASHGGGPETENRPWLLDFDLNEFPPEWTPEE